MPSGCRYLLAASLLSVLASALPLHAGVAGASAAPSAGAASWTVATNGWNRSSSPTIADIDGDGVPEILTGHEDGLLRIVRADGTALPGWPQPATIAGSTPSAISASPSVADLDGDGRPEIIVGTGTTWLPHQHGGLIVFEADGSVRWRMETADTITVDTGAGTPDGYGDGIFSTPAVGDIDGDGHPDIVAGGWDLRIYAWDRDGHAIRGFPYWNDDTVWSSPALYDVDGDGRLEIFVGGDSTAGGPEDWSGGVFRALDVYAGGVRQLWKQRIGDVISSSPAIGDIDGDGRMDVVVGAGDYYHDGDGSRVWAWHLDDGTALAGWPRTTGGATYSSPALGDLDGDGHPEVVIGSRDGSVWAYRGNGTPLWHTPLLFLSSPGGPINASPVIADVDGDGRLEVVVGNDWGTFALDGATGAIERTYGEWLSSEASPAVGNFGAAGWRLVLAEFDTPNRRSRLLSYAIPSPGADAPWPQWRRVADHLGAPPSGGDALSIDQCRRSSNPAATPSPSSGSGYWFVTRDGHVHAFGAASFFGDLTTAAVTTPAQSIDGAPDGDGYWVLDTAGAVHAFGSAANHGSMVGHALNGRILELEPTVSGHGYWLLGEDGGVFSFGDAQFYGSMGGQRLNAPVISIRSTPSGRGYWLLAADGGVFSFGDAQFYGSTGAMRLNAPVISMAVNAAGTGYWLLGGDGGVFTFGPSLGFYGSVPGAGRCTPPAGAQLRASATGRGYWVLATDGEVFAFGDTRSLGDGTGLSGAGAAVDLAVRP